MFLTYKGKTYVELGINPSEFLNTHPTTVKKGDHLLDQDGNQQGSTIVNYPEYWNAGLIKEIKYKVYAKVTTDRGESGYIPVFLGKIGGVIPNLFAILKNAIFNRKVAI